MGITVLVASLKGRRLVKVVTKAGRLSKREILKKAYERGFDYERKYGGCCQCTLAAIQETLGQRNSDAFKSATAFAGGVGLIGDGFCGALLGGIMALSLEFGRERDNFGDPEKIRFKAYKLAKKLYDKFREEYGSGTCKGIQRKILGKSYDLWNEEEFKEFFKGPHVNKCPEVVGTGASWAAKIILDEKCARTS